jgi:hypothetical protein
MFMVMSGTMLTLLQDRRQNIPVTIHVVLLSVASYCNSASGVAYIPPFDDPLLW